MSDLQQYYDALAKADAAGDTAAAKQLADYIRSQKPSGKSYDAVNGSLVPTGSAAAQAALSPVEGNNVFQNAGLGFGRAFNQLGIGARQILGLDPGSRASDQAALDAPLMATAGGKVGNVLGNVAAAVPVGAAAAFGGIPAVPAAIGTGWLAGALQPAGSESQRIGNASLSAALAGGGQKFTDTLGSYLTRNVPSNFVAPTSGSTPSGLSSSQQQAAANGERLGMRLTPGQREGSVPLQQFEAKLQSQPWTSGPFNKITTGNQEALNRATAGAIGENSATVDSATLANASDRLGTVFNEVRNPKSIIATDGKTTTAAIDAIEQDVNGLIPGNVRDNPLVQNLESLTQQGSVTGQQLGTLSSKLGRAAAKQMTSASGDRDLGHALFSVKDHVDDLLQSSLSGEEASAYAAARSQYRALMQVTGRVGNVNPNTGDVGGGSFANFLQQTDKGGYLFGRNQSDMYNAVRFSQAFKPVVGNSGTATRLPMGLKDMALSIPGNFFSRAYLGAPNAVTGIMNAPGAIAGGIGSAARAAAPYEQAGLPGLIASYITQ